MSNDGGSVARRRTYLMRRGDVKYFVTDQEPAAPRAVELTDSDVSRRRWPGTRCERCGSTR